MRSAELFLRRPSSNSISSGLCSSLRSSIMNSMLLISSIWLHSTTMSKLWPCCSSCSSLCPFRKQVQASTGFCSSR